MKLTDQEIEHLAHRRARAKMGWIVHACVYVAVNAVLLIVHASRGHGGAWPLFPALGWGFGLAMHGISVFLRGSGALRGRLVDRERRRLLHERESAPPA